MANGSDMIVSKSRGYEIQFNGSGWVYVDTGEPIGDGRPCKHCGKYPVNEVSDGVGGLLDSSNICCGHGDGIVKILASMELHFVDSIDNDRDIVARVYYPDEGGRIEVLKGESKATLNMALIHELGHLVDWYLSKGLQSEKVEIREECAEAFVDAIGSMCDTDDSMRGG